MTPINLLENSHNKLQNFFLQLSWNLLERLPGFLSRFPPYYVVASFLDLFLNSFLLFRVGILFLNYNNFFQDSSRNLKDPWIPILEFFTEVLHNNFFFLPSWNFSRSSTCVCSKEVFLGYLPRFILRSPQECLSRCTSNVVELLS